MKAELKRIRRQANRFWRRHRNRKLAQFTKFDVSNKGQFLRTDFGVSPN